MKKIIGVDSMLDVHVKNKAKFTKVSVEHIKDSYYYLLDLLQTDNNGNLLRYRWSAKKLNKRLLNKTYEMPKMSIK